MQVVCLVQGVVLQEIVFERVVEFNGVGVFLPRRAAGGLSEPDDFGVAVEVLELYALPGDLPGVSAQKSLDFLVNGRSVRVFDFDEKQVCLRGFQVHRDYP